MIDILKKLEENGTKVIITDNYFNKQSLFEKICVKTDELWLRLEDIKSIEYEVDDISETLNALYQEGIIFNMKSLCFYNEVRIDDITGDEFSLRNIYESILKKDVEFISYKKNNITVIVTVNVKYKEINIESDLNKMTFIEHIESLIRSQRMCSIENKCCFYEKANIVSISEDKKEVTIRDYWDSYVLLIENIEIIKFCTSKDGHEFTAVNDYVSGKPVNTNSWLNNINEITKEIIKEHKESEKESYITKKLIYLKNNEIKCDIKTSIPFYDVSIDCVHNGYFRFHSSDKNCSYRMPIKSIESLSYIEGGFKVNINFNNDKE